VAAANQTSYSERQQTSIYKRVCIHTPYNDNNTSAYLMLYNLSVEDRERLCGADVPICARLRIISRRR